MTPEPGKLLLRVVTPRGEAAAVSCDSIRMQTPDGMDGKNGGWIGIRRGHTTALMALTEGPVHTFLDGVPVRTITISEGFASVKNDVVTILCSSAE